MRRPTNVDRWEVDHGETNFELVEPTKSHLESKDEAYYRQHLGLLFTSDGVCYSAFEFELFTHLFSTDVIMLTLFLICFSH